MTKKKYDELKHLLRCYFHQDMDLEYKDPAEALRAYVFETPDNYVKATLSNIMELKEECYDVEQLWTVIGNLGCEYRYQDYYMAPEKWLDYLSDTIKKYLTEKENLGQKEHKKV